MKYEITEEQIKDIALGGGKTKIKEMFPEAFETKLEVGKWYKNKTDDNFIFFSTTGKCEMNCGYGIAVWGDWKDDINLKASKPEQFREATESEVFEALKKEAVKRGYEGNKIKIIKGSLSGKTSIGTIGNDFDYFPDENKLNIISNHSDYTVFINGKWAEIIKKTPEDFLNEIFKADLICKTDKDKYPNSVFYFQGETFLLEIEKTSEKLYTWVNYSKIWNPISTKFGLNYSEIQKILKVMIEDHFKLRDVTPDWQKAHPERWIEHHFKLRDVTPSKK